MRAGGAARISRGLSPNGNIAIAHRYRLRTHLQWARADAVDCLPGRYVRQVRGQNVDALPVIANLRGPEILDLLGMLGGIQHAPTIDAQLAVGKRNRSQFHAHAVKLRNKSFNVEVRHSRFSFNPRSEADFGKMQPIMRAPTPRRHSGQSENPMLRSIAMVRRSSAAADATARAIRPNTYVYADSAKLGHSFCSDVPISG
jgi:hypothetical protein